LDISAVVAADRAANKKDEKQLNSTERLLNILNLIMILNVLLLKISPALFLIWHKNKVKNGLPAFSHIKKA
jgi:hypothetical protein